MRGLCGLHGFGLESGGLHVPEEGGRDGEGGGGGGNRAGHLDPSVPKDRGAHVLAQCHRRVHRRDGHVQREEAAEHRLMVREVELRPLALAQVRDVGPQGPREDLQGRAPPARAEAQLREQLRMRDEPRGTRADRHRHTESARWEVLGGGSRVGERGEDVSHLQRRVHSPAGAESLRIQPFADP